MEMCPLINVWELRANLWECFNKRRLSGLLKWPPLRLVEKIFYQRRCLRLFFKSQNVDFRDEKFDSRVYTTITNAVCVAKALNWNKLRCCWSAMIEQMEDDFEDTFFEDAYYSSEEEFDNKYRYSSLTLFSSLLCIDSQDEVEWPSLQSLHTQDQQQQQAFALRETSKDSGIHEMTEEKRRSAKRKEWVW